VSKWVSEYLKHDRFGILVADRCEQRDTVRTTRHERHIGIGPVDRLVVDEPDFDARPPERGAVGRDGDGFVLLSVAGCNIPRERLPESALTEENVVRALIRVLAQNRARLARRDAREALGEPRGRALLQDGYIENALQLHEPRAASGKKKRTPRIKEKNKMMWGLLDLLVVLVIVYAFVVAVYNTFLSDCTIAGSDSFWRKLATWFVAWPLMLMCKTKQVGSVSPLTTFTSPLTTFATPSPLTTFATPTLTTFATPSS
jgi:hypothetical protein